MFKKSLVLSSIFAIITISTYIGFQFYTSLKNNNSSLLVTNKSPEANSRITISSPKKINFSTIFAKNKLSGTAGYFGSKYKDNYVWGGAMNLAWNELNDNVLHEKLRLDTTDKIALTMVDGFNNPVFTRNDLDEKSYYVRSGFGQKTVALINSEVKIKFPTKSFSDLQLQLADADIISYAYFLKEIQYAYAFKKGSTTFQKIRVDGFYASDANQRSNVNIVKYWSDDNFIVSLNLQDNSDQIFLCKGFDMNDPSNIVSEINKYKKESWEKITKDDSFQAPMINLDYSRNYNEMIGKNLANQKFKYYQIEKMFENIKFKMDEKGARVENEAAIVARYLIVSKGKFLNLNKPYWIIMKRANSQNPYFILGINNTNLMTETAL